MGVGEERMHSPNTQGKEEETGALGAATRGETGIWICSLAMFLQVPLEGNKARSPEPSRAVVTSQLPTGQKPWGLPGRWPLCPFLLPLTLPQPLERISCCLHEGPICCPQLSWQPFPRGPLLFPDTWHLRGSYLRGSLPLFSLSVVERALAL